MGENFLKKSKILIVDDREANIDVLTGLLDIEGYHNIKTTTDSREVLNIYWDFKPDLILLDLMMPFMDGFEVMELLRKEVPQEQYLPILVLTADTSDKTKKRALSNGATDFLSKPFDLIEVALRIKNLLHINYLHKQLLNQNLILEERVKERTEELRLQNAELKAAWEKAESSDRLKTSFINNISHEIRTPLNGIIGFTQLLSDSDIPEDEKESYMDLIYESGERLINTVTDFMDISLLNSGNMEFTIKEVAVDLLLWEVTGKFEKICHSKNLKLEVRPDASMKGKTFQTDELLTKKILTHMVDNAVKFTEEGEITVGVQKRAEDICFYVKDTGIGISEKAQKDIFQNFSQEEFGLTRNYEGSGLGLSISKRLVELMGGKIWVESELSAGSAFFFSLPNFDENSSNTINNMPSKPQTRTKILVVEDDEINFEYMSILLKSKFIEVVHAVDGIHAVELLRNEKDIKIVLMDMVLPRQDGFESTRQIKEINADIPVFAITALAFSEHREKAFAAGCNEFIIKPLKKNELFQKLRKYNVFV